MDISGVTNSMGTQYEAKNIATKKEGVATNPNTRDLGVIVEVSKDSELAAKMADGMVSFYGASVTMEQSEKLQSVITELEGQGHTKEALGNSFEPGTYAQLGLKVSQLSYACKEMGLSEDATKQITDTYGKQTEEKIGRVNGMLDALKTKMGELKQNLYKEIQEKGNNGAYERYQQAAKAEPEKEIP